MENAESHHDSNPRAWLLVIAVATAAVTALTFPVIIYTSVILYGLPAAAYVLSGYMSWLVLMKRDRGKGLAFAAGFAPVVAFYLLIPLSASPLYVAAVLSPVVCLWLALRLVR